MLNFDDHLRLLSNELHLETSSLTSPSQEAIRRDIAKLEHKAETGTTPRHISAGIIAKALSLALK